MDLAYSKETAATLDSDLGAALDALDSARQRLSDATLNMVEVALQGSDTAEGVRAENSTFNTKYDDCTANLRGLRKGAGLATDNAFAADGAARAMFA